jgi:hypothetical protein
MNTDPVQLLIEAGAIPSSPFGAASRYVSVSIGRYVKRPGDPGVNYVLRRFIPQRRDITIVGQHVVQGGERPELVAAQVFGDPELYWRLADANAVTDPFELNEVGRRIAIPTPPGM